MHIETAFEAIKLAKILDFQNGKRPIDVHLCLLLIELTIRRIL